MGGSQKARNMRRKLRKSRSSLPWWRLLPILLPFVLFFLGGVAASFVESLKPGQDAYGRQLLGLENYLAILEQADFTLSLRHSLRVAFLSSSLSTLLGLGLALLIQAQPRQYAIPSLGFYLPLILPPVSVAYLSMFWLGQHGQLAAFLSALGLDYQSPLFQGDGFGIIISYVYKESAFGLLMILPVLKGIPGGMTDCARNLGASRTRIFLTLVLPRLAPALSSVFIMLFVYSFGAYDIPSIIGESRPTMISLLLYRVFFFRPIAERPMAAAFLVIIFLMSLAALVLYSRLMSGLDEKERRI